MWSFIKICLILYNLYESAEWKILNICLDRFHCTIETKCHGFFFLKNWYCTFQSPAAYESIEKNAIDIANSLGAEFWAISSKTGKLCRKIVLYILIIY